MRKNIYVPDQEVDVIVKLQTELNASRYLVDLVKKDLYGGDSLTKEEVEKMIRQYLSYFEPQQKEKSPQIEDLQGLDSIQDILNL